MQEPDTVYGNRVDAPVSASYDLSRPWAPGEAAKCAQALATVEAPAEDLRLLRPPLPQVPLLPPRFGYGHDVPDVEECVDLDRDPAARYDFSGSEGSYAGSSYPSLAVW
jgi:hypothetical protein